MYQVRLASTADAPMPAGCSLTDYAAEPMNRFALFSLLAAVSANIPAAPANPDTVDEWCDYLGNRLRSVSAKSCHAQSFVAAPERTSQGNALVFSDVDTKAAADGAKRILVIGGIHGDELTSVSIVFRWIDWLNQPDAAIYNWRVIPVANPDGLKAKPSTRVNSHGVDLNRNFQTPDWDKDADDYWVRRTHRDPRRYPGVTPASEVETRWLQTQVEEFKPDLIISVHAPYNLLDYDGPVPEPIRFGRLSLNRLGVYPGSLGNYAGVHKQIPVITIELPNATAMPSQRDQVAMWEDMLKWMKNNINTIKGMDQIANGKSVDHTVADKATAQPAAGQKAAKTASKSAERPTGDRKDADQPAGNAKAPEQTVTAEAPAGDRKAPEAAPAGTKAAKQTATAEPAAGDHKATDQPTDNVKPPEQTATVQPPAADHKAPEVAPASTKAPEQTATTQPPAADHKAPEASPAGAKLPEQPAASKAVEPAETRKAPDTVGKAKAKAPQRTASSARRGARSAAN